MSSHRPWPVPERPWVMRMRWKELLFAHWAVPTESIRARIPAGLELDTFDGKCWVGAVPFLMEDVSPRGVPAIRGLHAFPELNLRTYVVVGGKPGVWFFSLDAGQRLAVRAARRFFHLPYFDARFEIELCESVRYRSERIGASAVFDASYRPVGPVFRAAPGSFDAWLTERYCLYSADGAGRVYHRLYRGDVDHEPWPLQLAEAEIRENTLGEWLGIPMEGAPQALHFAKSIDVRAWLIDRVAG